MDLEPIWSGIGGGAAVAGVLTLVRLLLDHLDRRGQRARDRDERRQLHEWDAEARLERVLEGQLDVAMRRAERCAAELEDERARRSELERLCGQLEQANALLGAECLQLRAGQKPAERIRMRSKRGPGTLLRLQQGAACGRRYRQLKRAYMRLVAEHGKLLLLAQRRQTNDRVGRPG